MAFPLMNTPPLDRSNPSAFGRFPGLYGSLSADQVQELETYAFHARLGYFQSTDAIWSSVVSREKVNFVFLIARIDCVLRQTRYRDAAILTQNALQEKLEARTTDFDLKQTKLLLLYQAYTNIFCNGKLRHAVNAANDVPNWLYSDEEPAEDFKV